MIDRTALLSWFTLGSLLSLVCLPFLCLHSLFLSLLQLSWSRATAPRLTAAGADPSPRKHATPHGPFLNHCLFRVPAAPPLLFPPRITRPCPQRRLPLPLSSPLHPKAAWSRTPWLDCRAQPPSPGCHAASPSHRCPVSPRACAEPRPPLPCCWCRRRARAGHRYFHDSALSALGRQHHHPCPR